MSRIFNPFVGLPGASKEPNFLDDHEIDSEDLHDFIEIVVPASLEDIQSHVRYLEREVHHNDVEAWLDGKNADAALGIEPDEDGNDSTKWARLRVLLSHCAVRGPEHNGPDPPYTQSVWSKISDCFGIPPGLFSAGYERNRIVEFEAFDNGFGIAITQIPPGIFCVTHNPATNTTYAVVLHLPNDERYGLCDYTRFKESLHLLRDSHPHCVTVIAAWLCTGCRRVCCLNDANKYELERIFSWSLQDETCTGRLTIKPLGEIDFQKVIARLTFANEDLSREKSDTDMHQNIIKRIIPQTESYCGVLPPNLKHSMSRRLRIEMCNIRDVLADCERKRNEAHQTLQLHWQMVYSLISQRDNEITLEVAAASKRIAEFSLRDAATMKQLTKNSQEIAVRTYQDSVNMKIVALINLLTLPGTFTATFFSTSFFNFEPKNPNRVASAWLWIYFIVTTGLAAALATCWYLWSTHAEKKGEAFKKVLTIPEDEGTRVHEKKAAETRSNPPNHSLREGSLNISREDTVPGAVDDNDKTR